MLSASVAILALAIWGWHQLVPDWQTAVAPVVAITVLTIALGLAGKWVAGNGKDAALGVLIMSASVAVLAAAVYLWRFVEWEDMGKAGAAIVVVAGLIAAVSALAKDPKSILNTGIAMAITAVSIGLLALTLALWAPVEWSAMAKAGLGLAVITGAVFILGKQGMQALLGAAAIAAAAVSVGILAISLKHADGIDDSTYLSMGLFLGATAGVLLLLSGSAAMSLIGAASLVIAGAAILIFAVALEKVANIDTANLLEFGVFVGAVNVCEIPVNFA
jgi:hypothetical protein